MASMSDVAKYNGVEYGRSVERHAKTRGGNKRLMKVEKCCAVGVLLRYVT